MNKDVIKIFSKVILSNEKINIKLLGDSITHGVGGTGFLQNGEKIVDGFARNTNGYCWAKQFKDYMESNFNCVVTNNACTGTNIQFVIENFDKLVSDEDDIVLCTIGTNNRHQGFDEGAKHSKEEHMSIFYENIIVLHNKFKAANKDVVFVANIPASTQNEKDGDGYWRIFHMNDVERLYQKAAVECGFPLIKLYSKFKEYCDLKNIELESLLADGLHPNDKGYDVMFKLIMREIGIAV